MPGGAETAIATRQVRIPPHGLTGDLAEPENATAIVLFAHGSGSSRLSPRNTQVARALNRRGFTTLLFDLLTTTEENDRRNVFNIALLAERLGEAIDWVRQDEAVGALPIGLFGASTGAAAALVAAAQRPEQIGAVVSRGGRPDLADAALVRVSAPTLLIVGGADVGVIELNQQALEAMRGTHRMEIVPGATHLFPEPGALQAVIALAGRWFTQHLASS